MNSFAGSYREQVLEVNTADVGSFPRASSSVLHYHRGDVRVGYCTAICEHEYRIVVNGKPLVNLLCSNAALAELAYGFLVSEQVIHSLDDIVTCVIDEGDMTASFDVRIPVQHPACPTISSGFGGKVLCAEVPGYGRDASLGEEASFAKSLPTSDEQPNTDQVYRNVLDVLNAMDAMDRCAREYSVTRGIHCSALFRQSTMLGVFEDIGRHNTFDKLAGHCLLKGIGTEGTLLTTTGRVSGEMIRKAIRLGVEGVASFSGPTDVAIDLAQKAGTFLVGYAEKSSAMVYSGFSQI